MSFFSNKTRINNKISLFRAFSLHKTYFNATSKIVYIAIVFAVSIGGYYAYAQTTSSERYVIETVHVFPEHISSNGWKNVDQIGIQNLSNVSLYQEFNAFNSAYIDIETHRKKAQVAEDKNEKQDEAFDEVIATDAVVAGTITPTENTTQEKATSTDLQEVSEEPSDTPTTTVDQESIPEEEVNNSLEDTSEESPVTKIRKTTSLFALAFASVRDFFPFAQESVTTTTPEHVINEVVAEEVDTATSTEEILELPAEENETSQTSIVDSATTTDDSVTVATSTEVTDEIATSTDENIEVEEIEVDENTATTTTATSTPVEIVEEEVEYVEIEPCEDDCIPYVVTLSDFGLPIFDQTLRLGGGQMRVSFAAKRKSSHDEMQHLSVNYSFDGGEHWQSSGVVLIDDEASNSINGGYYLFSIPELTTPEDLDALSVEIRYQDDPRALDGIFLESAWLELFTVKAPDVRLLDASELLEDNGYDPEVLSGDTLRLEDGSNISFKNIDENNGESLIIKSDRSEYGGLSKTTTYFSVTNTSSKADTFSLKTYFPDGVGEVSAIEQWNQNKEKKVVLPEYRPYAYYCAAGWEATEQPENDSLLDISKLLAADTVLASSTATTTDTTEDIEDVYKVSNESAPTPTATPEIKSTQSTSTQIHDENVFFTTTPESSSSTLSGPPEESTQDSIATTTALQKVTSAYSFTQAVTKSTSTSQDSVSQETIKDDYEDPENNYACRDTNIVRRCDSIEGDNTSCVLENVKVQEHTLTRYEGGWESVKVVEGDNEEQKSLLKRAKSFFGFGPDIKPVPSTFEVRASTQEKYSIAPGETKYFKMDISFPMFSEGEFWVEAVGDREYGLLDPFWSSQWQYRIPILIDNTDGTSPMTQQQVYLQLDSAMSDFWGNVNSDGSDIRFVQESTVGNLYAATTSQYQNALGSAWQDKITLTIPAASVSTGVSEFPVFVDLSTLGSTFWNGVASDGRDIRVTKSDGATELPLDIVEIDTVAKTGELHFLADALSASSDTNFHIYFNNPTATAYASTSPLGSQAVWKNYKAVYHFSDDPTAVTNIISDETGNGNELEVEGAALATTTGAMGTALDMTGTSVGILRDVGNDFAWTAGDDLVSTGLYYQTINSAEAIWQFGTSSNPNWSAYMPWYVNASTTGRGYMYFGRNAWTEWARDISVWHHFTTIAPATVGDFHGIYDNAVTELSSTQSVTNPSNLGGLQIGRWTTAGSYNGLIDELRFAQNDDTYTAGWISTEHLNQTNPSTFYATSTGVLAGGDSVVGWFSTSWNKRQKISISAQPASLTDFPVYVDLATLGADFFASVASDGRDIRVVKGDNKTEVPFELVAIDIGAKTGELYFKSDLGTDATSDFYIYFDNSDAQTYTRTDAYGSDNVWTNNYQAVYHLEEEATGVGNVNVYKDSTANAYDGDDETVSTGQGGKLGAGQQFGTNQNDHLSLPKQAMDGLTDTTVSWWHNTTITGAQSIVSAASGSGGSSNEYLDYFANQTGFYMYNETLNNYFGLAYPMNDGVWHSFSSVRNASTSEVFLYYDGAPDSENPDSLVVDTINVANGGLIVGQDQDSVGGGFASNQNFEGQLDELRIASVVRDDQWIASEYRNQDAPTEFYATSSVETLQATEFSELDFWLQHFSTSTNEADIWVQVDSIPAGEQATIWMYYGNSGAQSASDEFAPFTFDTLTDTYYVVHGNTATDIVLYSLIDNNQVQVDGGTVTNLNAGESMTISGYASTSVISTLGPITSRQSGTVEGEPVVPISFAASTHIPLGNRNNPDQFHVYAPFSDASVSIYSGAAGTPSASGTVPTGSDKIFSFDIPSYTNAAILESTQPVLLYNEGANINDSVISYPPTTEDLFGFHSNYWFISTADTTTNYDVYCESGATGIGQTVTRGVQGGDNICPQANDAANNTAVRITGQTNPVTAMQQADSDGFESTIFLPEKEFGTEYYIPTSADYVAVICTPHFGTTTLEIYAPGSGTPTETATCSPTATSPDSVRFANGGIGDSLAYAAGARVVSTNNVPFYVIYDDNASVGDETNVWSSVQSRKYHNGDIGYSIGEQEVANDAQYEQLSFLWYQNGDALTPTTTWEIGPGEYVSEGDAITGSGAVDTGDILRLRMNLKTSNATGTADATAFKLQYTSADSGQCSVATTWTDLGAAASTTATFRGYNNASVSDGATLATSTLASTTILATYEERNLSNFLPTDLSIGDIAEWDWVIEANQVEVNTNYCFRMVRAAGTELVTYTTYPEVESVGPPDTPTPFLHFDNEKTAVTQSILEFAATDIAGDEINYEVEIDNDRYFGSPEVTRNSVTNFLEFENLVTTADKAPFNSGARIRFNSPTNLATGTTYWWRVRASDPSGSATSSDWSTPFSFTVDDTVTVSQWHQTTGHQFSTDTLSNVSTTTTQVSVTSNQGKIISTPIDFDDASVGNAWGEVSWNDTETSGEIVYQVEYLQNGSWQLVPDDLIPGNVLGTSTSPINILELDTNIYNQIRLVAILNGTNLSIQDWTVTWGLRVETPTLGDLFDNEKTALTLPVFDFTSTDPQNDDLEYEISWGASYDFTGASTTHNSGSDPGFSNQTTGGDTSPFNSGDTITYTTQAGEAFTNGQTYWWRVRAKDPTGGDSWSPWSEPDSFTIDTALTVSSWFQTTEDQFNQGELAGVVATSSGSVVMVEDIGEYGSATLTDNNWKTISTQNTYRNMVVVASPEYNVTNSNGRSPRVRNKTNNSFQIKVDNYTSNFVGSTDVSYVVMEAGTWNIADGAGGTQVVAGSEKSVSKELIRAYQTGYTTDVQINFSPAFSSAPTAFATIASDNDTSWVMTHTDGCGAAVEVLTTQACIFMAESTNTLADHQPEDIDYVFFGTVNGTNNGTAVKAFNSPDAVTGNAVTVSYPTAFSTAPAFVMAYNNAEDGGDGGMGSVTTAGTHNASQTVLQISEFGTLAGGHTAEIVSVLAFENASGIIKRDSSSGALSGEIRGEDIIFTDGAGPKFDNFTFTDSTPGGSDIVYQLEYKVSEGVYALIPDMDIPGNSIGTSTSPIDLTGVDIDSYGIIRPFATFTCAAGVCPELQEWKVEWSQGVNMSGTLKQYDRSTNVATGTIKAAINGVPVAGSGSVAGGVWTLNNVTAFAGDVITVWVDGAPENNEAVTVFTYDGLGDINNVALYEQHLAIDAGEKGTLTNASMSVYDNSVSGDEDIFFDVDILGNLTVCAVGTCPDANIYIASGQTYIAATTSAVTVMTHDFINEGAVELDANTFKVSGSWINTATSSTDTSTILMTASTTDESISSTESPLNFHNLTFGGGSGTSTYTISAPLDLSGNLSVVSGTLDRGTNDITVEGNVNTGLLGNWSGVGTTTFDGSASVTWTDAHASTSVQNIGNVVIDGASKIVTVGSDVRAYDVTIGGNDTLSGGGSNTIFVHGDWTNTGTFLSETSTIEFVNDDRVYPPIVPGSSDWYSDTNFVDRVPVTINASEVLATLTDFPVYLDLSTLGNDFWNSVQSDGDDIRITQSDGQTELPYELVSIDTIAKTGELHFLADSISNATNTTFYIYHNNPSAGGYSVTAPYGRNSVWKNYEAVYHFNDDVTSIGSVAVDASGHGKDLQVTIAGLATSTGKLGLASDFNGSTGIMTDPDWSWSAGDIHVASGWYKMSAASSEGLWSWGTGSTFVYLPWYTSTYGYHRFGSTAGGTSYTYTPRSTNWTHFTTIAPTSTGQLMYVYDDTIERDSTPLQVDNPSAGPLQIGRYTTAGSINAEFDELRFATSSRSTDWIETEYSNQNTPTIFYSTSSVQSYVPDTIIDEATHAITAGGSNFYNLTFNDATTSPAFVDPSVIAEGDFTIATGTISMPTGKMTIGGSFLNSGVFMHNNAEIEFNGSGAESITLSGTAYLNALYNVTFTGSGSWDITDSNATTTNNFIINSGTVSFPSGTLSIGGTLNTNGGGFTHNNGSVVFTPNGNQIVTTNGSSFNNVQFGDGTALSWYGIEWEYRTEVSIKAGTVGETLTDFPVYVNLAGFDDSFWDYVKADGGDIRVTKLNGVTEVPVDLVEIDTTTKTGELHFLADTISPSATTTFYVYFGNTSATLPSASSQYGSQNVWKNYEAVYHFNDGVLVVTDETSHGRDLNAVIGTAATTTGLIGQAIDTTASSVRLDTTGWTWTAGENLISSGLYFMDAVDNGALWQFGAGSGSNNGTYLSFLPWYTSNDGYHQFGYTSAASYSFVRDNTVWHHFTTIGRAPDGSTSEIYDQNILRDSWNQITSSANPSNTDLRIGCYQNTTCTNIQIDELRIATSTPSSGRMTAEYNNLTDVVNFYATSTATVRTDSVATYTLNEPVTDADGNVIVVGTRVISPSTNFTIGGSFTVTDAIFDANNATVTMDSATGAETLSVEGNNLYNLTFNNLGGDWTTVANMTIENNMSLLSGAQFTQATGTTITVSGIFSNAMGAVTTWDDSTLVLNGGDYIVTDKLSAGDTYATMEVSSDSDIVIWNSSISTSTIQSGSSIYMPDFAGTDGLLRIYGDYDRASGDEYWSYATDFDGTDLSGGSERMATVEIENASQLTFASSSTLHIVGDAIATTTVSELFGLYEITLDGATLDMQYAQLKGLGVYGLHLTNGSTITQMSDSNVLIASGRSGITADISTINAQPSTEYQRMSFATTTATNFYDLAWSDQMIISIKADAVDSTLTEFPVYVDLSTLGPAFWAGVQSDGRDIRMTTQGADELPIDLVWIDASAQKGELYFLAPELSSSKDSTFYIHYNNPSAVAYTPTDTYGTNAVWKNYEAVYHFNDGATQANDATEFGRDLYTVYGTTATTSGFLGEAIDMTASNARMDTGAWTWKAGDDLISSGLYFMTNTDTGALWQFGTGNGSNNGTYLAFMPNYDLTNRGRNFFGMTSGAYYTVTGYDNTIWHHFTTIGRAANGATNEIYEDGLLWNTVTQSVTSQNPSNTTLKIGCYQNTTCSDIQVDELRFATTTPSNAWRDFERINLTQATTTYATSTQSSTFYNVTADGVPATFWRFSNGTGSLYGESYDNDEGDPGSIQWDDSNYGVTISGVVYADDGETPMGAPVCNGSTEVVKVVIDGGASYTTPCDPRDGSYEITGITYSGEPKITTYIESNATTSQVNVVISDEVTGSGTVVGTAITLNRPEVIDGTVLVAIIGKDDDPTVTAPAGWVTMDTLGNTTGDNLFTGIWYKVIVDAATEPTTYTFTTSDNTEGYSYWMGSLMNVDTVTPIDVASAWTKYQNQYTPDATPVTTVTDGALVLAAWHVFLDTDVTVPFSQWDILANNIASGDNGGNMVVVSRNYDVATTTNSVEIFNVAEARESQAGQFAFRPAAGVTATGTVTSVVVTKTPLGAAAHPYKDITLRDQKTGFAAVASGGVLSVDAPHTEDGDVLVAIVGKDDFYTTTAPVGWILADDFTGSVGSRAYSGIWYKVVTNASSEPATYSWTNNDTSTEEHMYWIGAFDNVDTTQVFDITPNWSNVQNTSTPIAPSIATVSDGTFVLAAWMILYDNTMNMPGSPWTTLAEDLNISQRALSVVSRSYATAGATGDVSLTGGSNDDVNVGQFALRPEPLSVANSIDDMDLYSNRVIVRHEDATPIAIADLTVFDNSNDADIPYTAATGTPDTLQILSGNGLMVWDNKTFIPGGVVDLQGVGTQSADGSLLIGTNATYTATGSYALTVGGSFYGRMGAMYNPASSTVTFTATSTGHQIGSAASSTFTFADIAFTGVGGGWQIQTPIVSNTDILVGAGTVSGVSDITVNNGSLSGGGVVDMSGGTTLIKRTNTLGGAQAWSFNNLTLGDGVTADTTTPVSSATTTIRGALTITANHFLDAGSSVWDLTGSGTVFTETGTFLEGTSLVQYSGTAENILKTSYYDLHIDAATGTVSVIAPSIGLSVLNDLVVGTSATSTLDLTANNPVLAVGGDIYIGTKGTLLGSNTSTLEAYGSWDNNGVFTANGGEVEFKASAGTKTIAAGNSSFYDLSLTGSGLFDITENATSTHDMSIGNFTSFTLDSGTSLAVGSTFTNPGFANTWTGSTLYLYGGQAYEINTKGQSDTYATFIVGSSTQPRLWDSTFSTTTVDTTGSLYSMNHNTVIGDLYIFGHYINSGYNDYWDYARDWDGSDLSGSERQANVYIEGAGGVKYIGGSVSVTGSSTASTTIQNQGSGTYELYIGNNASTSWQYSVPRNLTADGIILSGNAVVDTFDNLDLLAEINSSQVLTVGGTVIDVNPAKNFDLNIFNSAIGVTGAVNVTATGTSVSSWRFTNHTGNLDGEALDNDGGDPGEIVWIDSAALITIGGTVYSDEGATVSAVCDGVTNNVTIMVAGLTAYHTTCDAVTGAYSISNIGFGPSDSIIAYIDGEIAKGATVTTDPISNIANMDIYENRVIVRHESTDQVRIADLAVWDSSDDADIPFTAVDAATDTLTLPANTKLIVWTNKEFAPAGNVTLSGGGAGAAYDGTLELYDGATWTSAVNQEHSIGGSLISGVGATFDAALSTTTFTTSAAGRTVDINEDSFYNVAFTGTGSWTISDNTLDTQNLVISGGTVTLPTATTTVTGIFDATGGTFVHNGTVLVMNGTDTNMTVAFGGSDIDELHFTGSGSWNMTDTDATSTASVIITNGTVTLPSNTFAMNGNFRNEGGVVIHNTSELILNGTGASTLLTNGSDLGSVKYIGSGDLTMEDNSLTLAGSLTAQSGTVIAASGTLSIGGSLDATGGVLTHSSGTILFNSSDAGETVNMGSNDFYNVVFGSASGGWTITSNATATHNFTLSAASSFTQQAGTTLRVEGVFSNTVGGPATTWSGTTLELDSGTTYEINTKASTGDAYNILTISTGTDISMWNSDADTINVTASSSVYSQDHAGVDGYLDIFGSYLIATSSEYWSYATDFDGAALGAGSRQVIVSFATTSSSSVGMTGGSLEILGTPTATTTIDSAGAGEYAMNVSGGILNASYYDFTNQDLSGLNLSGTPTITSLSHGSFTQSKDNAVSITLSASALNNNASLITTGTRFDNAGFAGGVNVSLDATTTSNWSFTGHTGNLSGEAFDVDGSDACSSIRWDDSDCLLTEQTHYRWRNDNGGEGAIDSTWFDNAWAKRKRIRVINDDTTTYGPTAVKIDVVYDADMQTDFDDVRFTDSSGTTSIPYWIEKYSVGVSAEVWVQVPSMVSESTTEVYMYYSNNTATTTSSSTQTFAVADDFDDGNISEYTGDTGLFTAGGSFAYGGGFGLDTSGNEGARATDGIFRSDVTVSQGEIIRYRQYIDTGSGSSDEACTLFGVQDPGTNNSNYGVCLELFGVDRMSLVKDAESTDTYGAVTVLASTTVTYVTGWYNVEVDWQTNNVIDVTLFDSTGSIVATTTATDSTYTSGGIGFTYWGFNGGWDSYTSQNRTQTPPKAYFGAEQTKGGATWAADQDTPVGGFQFGDTVRLRMAIENSGLPITNQKFKLEFAPKLTAPSCEAVSSGNFGAVPNAAGCGGSAVCMTASTTITDGAATTDHLLVGALDFVPGQTVIDPSNKTSNIDVDQGKYTELEYAINLTANAVNDAYCFRVTNDGSLLDSYASIAELTLAFDPTMGPVTFNGGNDITLTPGATTTVIATTTVTDFNGYTDLTAASSTFYTTSAGAACTADDNNCYKTTTAGQCSFSECAGNSCLLTCTADIQFHADPTDVNGEDWYAFLEVNDTSGGYDFATSIGIDLLTLRAMSIDNAIGYGTVDLNSDTGAFNPSTTLINQGNESIDIEIAGTDMTDGGVSVIGVQNQKYATSTFTYSSCTYCSLLDIANTAVEVDLFKPTSSSPPVEDFIYWGIHVPNGTNSAPHTGHNTFYVIGD